MDERKRIYNEMKNRLDETGKTIADLREKSNRRQRLPGSKGNDMIDDVHARQIKAEQGLAKLSQFNSHDWDKHKGELDRFFQDIDNALREALSYFH